MAPPALLQARSRVVYRLDDCRLGRTRARASTLIGVGQVFPPSAILHHAGPRRQAALSPPSCRAPSHPLRTRATGTLPVFPATCRGTAGSHGLSVLQPRQTIARRDRFRMTNRSASRPCRTAWRPSGCRRADLGASQIVEARDAGLRTSRLMGDAARNLTSPAGTGARDYHRLKAALDRLQSTPWRPRCARSASGACTVLLDQRMDRARDAHGMPMDRSHHARLVLSAGPRRRARAHHRPCIFQPDGRPGTLALSSRPQDAGRQRGGCGSIFATSTSSRESVAFKRFAFELRDIDAAATAAIASSSNARPGANCWLHADEVIQVPWTTCGRHVLSGTMGTCIRNRPTCYQEPKQANSTVDQSFRPPNLELTYKSLPFYCWHRHDRGKPTGRPDDRGAPQPERRRRQDDARPASRRRMVPERGKRSTRCRPIRKARRSTGRSSGKGRDTELFGVIGLAREPCTRSPELARDADTSSSTGHRRVAGLMRSALLAADVVLVPPAFAVRRLGSVRC